MTRKHISDLYLELPKHVKDMSATELRKYFPEGTDKSYLMRSIIMSEKRYGTVNYERSLRSFWYSAVKPTLDKLGLLSLADQTEEGLTKWDATLSRYMVDLLKRGELTYKDLSIVDNSRRRDNPANYFKTENLALYGHQTNTCPYPNIIVATEKDTVYNIIRDMSKLLGCSCISSKGQNSMGAMEDLVRGILARQDIDDDIYILTMTDYDPAGYYIAEALEQQVRDCLYALTGKRSAREVYIKRVGIVPDQLSPDMVEANKYTPKEANREKWFFRTGGIDGEEKGLELDALTPDEIREIFIDEIRDFIDPDIYGEFIKKSYIHKKALSYMAPYMQMIMQTLEAKYMDAIELEDFDVFELAQDGHSAFPVNDLCLHAKDNLINNTIVKIFKPILDTMASLIADTNPDKDGEDE